MKTKPLLEKLKFNWPAKAVCVIVACLFYLFNRYASLEKKSMPVSLNVVQDGEMVCASHIPSSVSVTISTSAENLSQVSGDNIFAQLDLSWITQEGTFEIPVVIDLPPNIVELDPLQVTVYPEKVKVRLEKNAMKSVKVEPLLSGKPAEGYKIESVESIPEFVSVFGPRSIVQSMASVSTEGVAVDGLSDSTTQTVRFANTNRLVKIYGAESAQVTAKIDYEDGIKEFKSLKILLRNLSANFECDTQKRASITLRGPSLLMNDWTPNPDTLSVDLSEIKEEGEYLLPVSVLIPQEFHLESVSVDNISVAVKNRPPAEVVDETLQAEKQ